MSDFSAKSNQYAIAALREQRVRMAGEASDLEAQLALRRSALVHLDAVLRMFAPDIDLDAIRPRKRKPETDYPVPSLTRRIMEVLRRRGVAMTTPEVVQAVAAEMGFDAKGAAAIAGRVRFTLRNLCKDGGPVQKNGERSGASWGIR